MDGSAAPGSLKHVANFERRTVQRLARQYDRPASGHSRLINPDGNVRFDQQRTWAAL
jgi:hypothetical protein